MRTTITLAVAALLNSAVLSWPAFTSYTDSYQNNTNIPYSPSLNETCTACVRGGFDACLYATGYTPGSVQEFRCNLLPTEPEIVEPVPTSTPNGHFCSYGATSQINSIVVGCRPKVH
jgi:hypothetical protein